MADDVIVNFDTAAIVAAINNASAVHAAKMDRLSKSLIGPNGVITAFTFAGGSAYTDGTYTVSLIGGSGSGAVVEVIVAGGTVTSVTLLNEGVGYEIGNILSATIPTGTGFSVTVTQIITSFASVISGLISAVQEQTVAIEEQTSGLISAVQEQTVAIEEQTNRLVEVLEDDSELAAGLEKLVEMTKANAVITEYWFKIGQAEAEEATKDSKIKISLEASEALVDDPALISAHNDALAIIKTP